MKNRKAERGEIVAERGNIRIQKRQIFFVGRVYGDKFVPLTNGTESKGEAVRTMNRLAGRMVEA